MNVFLNIFCWQIPVLLQYQMRMLDRRTDFAERRRVLTMPSIAPPTQTLTFGLAVTLACHCVNEYLTVIMSSNKATATGPHP